MQTWETMIPANFHPNWHDLPIKTEPTDSPSRTQESDSFEQKPLSFDATMAHYMHPLGFNPLTPPGYPNIFPSHPTYQRPNTPCTARDSTFPTQSLTPPMTTPPMDVTPPKSPKDSTSAETPEKDTEMGGDSEPGDDMFDISEDEDFIRQPKMNSHGKIKTYKCKQCQYVSVTKVNFWDHVREHMKPEKILKCKKCPFITEYKHHLEYHLRNHDNSKPFQCPQCSYSCVNKSMLNSHLKSHSTVLQYRCADCSYATKYCHSLKLHLRKYSHKPDVVLNLDGTPNPLPIIDVYGTRRGPKTKSSSSKEENYSHVHHTASPQPMREPSPIEEPIVSHPLSNIFQNSSPGMPLLPYLNLNLHMIAAQRMAVAAQLNEQKLEEQAEEEALNLVQKEQTNEPRTPKHRRKGRAFKLDRSVDIDEDTSLDTTINVSTSSSISNNNLNHSITNCNKTTTKESSDSLAVHSESSQKTFECKYCEILFKHEVLFSIHMGYHGYNDVFKCNMCGEQCDDRVSFFLHIARSAHT